MSARTDALMSRQETGRIAASIVLRYGRSPPGASCCFNAPADICFLTFSGIGALFPEARDPGRGRQFVLLASLEGIHDVAKLSTGWGQRNQKSNMLKIAAMTATTLKMTVDTASSTFRQCPTPNLLPRSRRSIRLRSAAT